MRGISLTYGQTTIDGGFIRTGEISSIDGITKFNLNTGVITGKITFAAGSSGYANISDKPILGALSGLNLVEQAQLGTTVITGGYLNTSLIDANYIRTIDLIATKVTTGKLQSVNTLNYFDLDNNKFKLGNATNYMDWNVTTPNVLTIKGHITADSGTISGVTINANDQFSLNGSKVEIFPNAGMRVFGGGYADFTNSTLKVPTVAASGLASGEAALWIGSLSGVASGASGGSVATLSDVALSSLATGQILVWNGSTWVNQNNVPAVDLSGYYTKTEVQNFFSGASSMSGYNKANWDGAYAASHSHSNKTFLDGITSGATVAINISGSAVSATQWNGMPYVGSDTTVNTYMLGYGSDAAWHPIGQANLRSFLGLGSNAYSSTAYLPLSGGSLSGALYGTEVRLSNWLYVANNYGIYNQTYMGHFYQSSINYWQITGGNSTTMGLKFSQTHESSAFGYVYNDSTGFGLLNGGSWSVRTTPSGGFLHGSWTTTGSHTADSFSRALYFNVYQDSGSRGGLFTYKTISGAGSDYGISIFSEANLYFLTQGSSTVRGNWNASGLSVFGSVYGNAVYDSGSRVLSQRGGSYYYLDNWIESTGTHALYLPSSGSGTHFCANGGAQTTSYGSFQIQGAKAGYVGLTFLGTTGGGTATHPATIMYDAAGNGGLYNGGAWHYYYGVSHDCLALGGSVTYGGYKAAVNGALRVTGTLYSDSYIQTASYFYTNYGMYSPTYGTYFQPVANAGWFFKSNDTNCQIRMMAGSDTIRGYIYADSGSNIGFLHNSGGWSLQTWNGGTQIYGTAYVTGDVIGFYSDKRLKSIKGRITNALSKLHQVSGVYYEANDLAVSIGAVTEKKPEVGLIAQEWKKVMPEVLALAPFDRGNEGKSKSGKNYMTMKYERTVPLIIEAVKEMDNKYESEIAYLKNRVVELERRLN